MEERNDAPNASRQWPTNAVKTCPDTFSSNVACIRSGYERQSFRSTTSRAGPLYTKMSCVSPPSRCVSSSLGDVNTTGASVSLDGEALFLGSVEAITFFEDAVHVVAIDGSPKVENVAVPKGIHDSGPTAHV